MQSLGVQNYSKASKMFDSQPLGCVICSNHIDYNLIILIFKGDVLINFDPLSPHVPIVVTTSPSRVDVLNGCSLSSLECSGPAVLNLWAAAHWWAADLCLVGRDLGWELRIFFDVSNMSQSMKRYQVLVVELELPLHT